MTSYVYPRDDGRVVYRSGGERGTILDLIAEPYN